MSHSLLTEVLQRLSIIQIYGEKLEEKNKMVKETWLRRWASHSSIQLVTSIKMWTSTIPAVRIQLRALSEIKKVPFSTALKFF